MSRQLTMGATNIFVVFLTFSQIFFLKKLGKNRKDMTFNRVERCKDDKQSERSYSKKEREKSVQQG